MLEVLFDFLLSVHIRNQFNIHIFIPAAKCAVHAFVVLLQVIHPEHPVLALHIDIHPHLASCLNDIEESSLVLVRLKAPVYNAADGYYHLNSVDGPILYLATGYLHDASNQRFGSTRWLRLSDAFAVTNEDAVLNFVQVLTDANGNKVKERYNNCMVQYINCADSKYGVYPLTEDLIYMLQQGGAYRGWFDSSNGNYIVPEEERNLSYNAEILWMFNCCYFE